MKKILFGELQRYITTTLYHYYLKSSPLRTELSHLKHVENSETVQELLAVVCTGLYMFSLNSTELVLYSSRRATINAKWAFTLIWIAIKQFDHHTPLHPDFASEQRALHAALFLVSALTEHESLSPVNSRDRAVFLCTCRKRASTGRIKLSCT